MPRSIMHYMSADFGADISSYFPFLSADKQTDRQTWLNVLPYAGSYTAGVAK